MALVFELAFLAVAPLALTRRGRKFVETEQARIDQEEVPPDTKGTPEHFDLLEKEMAEIQARIAPDVSELRARLEPRKLGRQAKQNARTRLRALLQRGAGRRR